jgi:photosystem II stability/assembly factor-like uncharacterized protein
MRFVSSLISTLFLCICSFAETGTAGPSSWISVGPDGGDVRTLSADPANSHRILLGTSAGQIYQSEDAGGTWQRFVRIGKGNDYVVDHIVFDPKQPGTIYVAAWTLEHEGGSVFKSIDNGHSWQPLSGMEGKSVRAMAMAPSDPNTLIVGALDGVYRSRNAGETWTHISPESSVEIKNIESIAIDPGDPDAIYAGTWHLPWKTTDGGRSWHNIKQGVIDDSDVFSIIIDPRQPQFVYASACSGIYKSENAGELFHKIQGIPFSARRTRVLKQDPANSNVVYAGTTEGLWKTSDAGRTWKRITTTDVIVNDVLVDAHDSNQIMLATDRSGVLASANAGATFEPANVGFAHRQVAALAVDPADENTLYAGLINDKQYGGVFVSHDQGAHWKQISAGLGGRDVFALRKAGAHLLAGTSTGVYELAGSTVSTAWRPLNRIANVQLVTVRKATKTRKAVTRKVVKAGTLKARVTDLEVRDNRWIAASTQGIFASSNSGVTWEGGPLLGHSDFSLVRSSPKLLAAAGRGFLLTSRDDGAESSSKAGCQFLGCEWHEAKLPKIITSINDVAFGTDESIWLACREGLYRSKDQGETWQRLEKLPVVNLASVFHDAENRRMLVTAMNSTEVFSTLDDGESWQRRESGWLLRTITEDGGRLLASTAFDGVVIEKAAAESADARIGQREATKPAR